MSAIRQGHERQKGPVVVNGRVDAIVDAEPAFYLRSPASDQLYSTLHLLCAIATYRA